MGPQNARLHEVWFNTAGDGAGTPVFRKVALNTRPGLSLTVKKRLVRTLEADQIEQSDQIKINAALLHAAVGASRGRTVRAGDRVTVLDLMSGGGPAQAVYRHFEVMSIDIEGDTRPGSIKVVTIGLKAAVPPKGSAAAENGVRR